jgi:hypothetical protein
VVGVWRRTLGRATVDIAIHPFDPLTRLTRLTPDDRASITGAARRYAGFLQLKAAVEFR